MKKRILSLLLALALVLTGVPMAFATESGFADGNVPEISTDGPVQLPSSNIAEEPTVETDAQQPVEAGEPKLVQNGEDRFSAQLAESEPKADEVVTFIVVMQKSPLLVAGFTKDDIATRAPKAVAYEAALRLELNALKANLTQKFRNDAQFELGYTYTIATTGVAVKTEYGNKEALEALPGVDHVYVAPTFSLPEEESTLTSDGELQPMTSNATTMIGADQLNATGFTGKGMKVAILDTGIVVDHPNFGALSEDKLTESSLTKEGVDAIWNTLNAGQMTSLRNRSTMPRATATATTARMSPVSRLLIRSKAAVSSVLRRMPRSSSCRSSPRAAAPAGTPSWPALKIASVWMSMPATSPLVQPAALRPAT